MSSLRDFEARIFDRINPLVRFSVTRYVLAIGLFVAVVAFGLISTLSLGVDQFPQINFPFVVVTTTYPGATPSVIDQQITQEIEDAVSSLNGITEIDSTSFTGTSQVVVSFDLGVNQSSAANEVASQVSAEVRKLPSGAQAPVVQTFDPSAIPIIQFGLAGGTRSLADVADYVQNNLTPLLLRVGGVANVQTDGAPARTFEVLLNPNLLQYYRLNPQQVVTAIESSAIDQPIGSIVVNRDTLSFSTEKMPADVAEISRIVVDTTRGITVADVGSVRDEAAATNIARVNGVPVVLVSVQKATGANSVAVVAGVRALLQSTQLPDGYRILVSDDSTGAIRATIAATVRQLAVTALVVSLIVLLFLGRLNTVLSVVLAIPIALSAAPVLYNLLGFTFNLISLLALIVAIGIVVDDSIVVAENVARYRAMGFKLTEAVLRGASEVFSAVVAASLSLLSVLIPVSFLPGIVGLFLRQFALGLAAAVAFSLLEAVLFLTVRLAYTPEPAGNLTWADVGRNAARFRESIRWGLSAWRKAFGVILGLAVLGALALTRHPVLLPLLVLYPLALGLGRYLLRLVFGFLQALTTTLHGLTEAGLEVLRDAYARSLGRVLRHGPWVLVGSVAMIVILAVVLFPRISFSFAPQSDDGTMVINLSLAPGTPLSVTNVETAKIERFLLARPEVRTVQAVVGSTGVFTTGVSQTQNATIDVQLVAIDRRRNVYDLIDDYRGPMTRLVADEPSAQLIVSASGGFQGQGSAVTLNIVSANKDLLATRNAEIVHTIERNPYVRDVVSSLSDATTENDFVPDDARIEGTGITPSAVADVLQTYASGTQAGTAEIGGLSYPIEVQIDPTYLSGGQSLLTLPVYSPTLQSIVEVGQLGSLKVNRTPVSLTRFDRLYTATLSIDLKKGAPPALALQSTLEGDLASAGLLKDGVALSPGSSFGPAALAKQLSTAGPLAFLLAVFLAYLVMAAQFNSWRYPVYLLLPVPLAIIGALLFVAVIGGGLDVFGVLGLLLLIGLSAKNAILYLDFVVERIGKMPLAEALIDSARLRFRPIVMTTLTVLVISGPLVFGHGEGSEFGQRLGVVMFGGIIFSAVLTFFVVPAAFYIFERKRAGAPRKESAAGE